MHFFEETYVFFYQKEKYFKQQKSGLYKTQLSLNEKIVSSCKLLKVMNKNVTTNNKALKIKNYFFGKMYK